MGWTPPAASWAAGFVPSAAWLKAQILDNFKALTEWQAYTPAWTAATTNPSIGNGTIAGSYIQAGNLVHFEVVITAGSTTSFGAGIWQVSLPVNQAMTGIRRNFAGLAYDASAAAAYPITTGLAGFSSSVLTIGVDSTTAGAGARTASGTVPFAWGPGDTLTIHGTYQAA